MSRRMSRRTDTPGSMSKNRKRSSGRLYGKDRRPSQQISNRDRELIEIDQGDSSSWSKKTGCLGLSYLRSVLLFGSVILLGILAIGGLFVSVILYLQSSDVDAVWKIFGIVICATVLLTIAIVVLCLVIFYYKKDAISDHDSDSEVEDQDKSDIIENQTEPYLNGSDTNRKNASRNPTYWKNHNNQTDANRPYSNDYNYPYNKPNHQYSNGENTSTSSSNDGRGTPRRFSTGVRNKQTNTESLPTTMGSWPRQEQSFQQQHQPPLQVQPQQQQQKQLVYSTNVMPRPIIVQVLDKQNQRQLPQHTLVSTFEIQPPQTHQLIHYIPTTYQQQQTKQTVPAINFVEQEQMSRSPVQTIVSAQEFYELDKFY
ncbi:unnamed protein product [Didymodactylos carnosus]|uniref:Uncharacterized protein n=1 Tax=Didymodactylos carnosus TaxID=1234261 RepID=A0A814JR49_9BILA|nr:unnamed protein product [Didymodactylos carnosus]CAF1096950.1 unnamed protein product [Didymodactylos carnosus]CAF3809425.1 unnamed protein product [Didymodactylos carnosus]CAF3858441.1 unnamed protein product [Didymodactylos carnosus]